MGALGIDADGHQRILGWVEGATENHTVVLALLQDLITRGLTAAHGFARSLGQPSPVSTGGVDPDGSGTPPQFSRLFTVRAPLDVFALV